MPNSQKVTNLDNLNKLNTKLVQDIQNNINTIYTNTYYNDNKNNAYINSIRKRIDNDINSLVDKNISHNNGSNISSLYAKSLAKNDSEIIKELRHTLQDESMISDIMDLYSQNAILKDIDREIDVVCKYMPKLEQALDIKADHVLSADHFNSDAIEIVVNSNDSQSSSNSDPKYDQVKDIKYFKSKYKLVEKISDIYKKTAKYGEQFIYITSYKKALQYLMQNKQGSNIVTEDGFLNESVLEKEINSSSKILNFAYREKSLNESTKFKDDLYELNNLEETPNENYFDIQFELNSSGIIPSVIRQENSIRRVINETSHIFSASGVKSGSSLLSNTSYLNNFNNEIKKFNKDRTLKAPTSLSIDGTTDINSIKKNNFDNIDVPGAVVRILDHTMVKAIYINDVCLGYYYIETNINMDYQEQTTFTSTLGGLRPRRSTASKENMNIQDGNNDIVLQNIAKQISSKIDANFINANQDLAPEIYSILKYNADNGNGGRVGKVRVSFIPPEEIVHCYFDYNDKTKRGRSDLHNSIFPAKLYSCLYISNTIALLTRGYDKRIYHVKQSVDTNITAVLMNVINQIKQSNFNLRQIENMNNIMNITGRFNDLVIPQNQNGESPINFDILPGQQIEIQNEFMRSLEEMAVNQTGVSVEMISTQNNDQTATHLTQTSSRFLMKIYNRQQKYQKILSDIITKIYQAEYNCNDTVSVKLPPPAMLNFTNTSQLLASGNELIQNIVQMKMGAEMNEEVKATFTGKLMQYYYNSFLPMNEINKLADETRIEVESNKSSGGSDNMGDPNMGM